MEGANKLATTTILEAMNTIVIFAKGDFSFPSSFQKPIAVAARTNNAGKRKYSETVVSNKMNVEPKERKIVRIIDYSFETY